VFLVLGIKIISARVVSLASNEFDRWSWAVLAGRIRHFPAAGGISVNTGINPKGEWDVQV
jgi:hypothetical protein